MKFKNLKKGFSLVELMIFFLFVSILIAASTPIITKRVKNVPLRAYHGKFLCYRDVQKDAEGNITSSKMVGEYYNSSGKLTKRVEAEDGETLPFIPPKRAAIYKIDMIGSGAGGYNYADYANETDPDHRSYFNRYGDGDSSGDSVYKLKDEDIKERFQGVMNTIVAYTGSGGRAGNVNYYYPVPAWATSEKIGCYSYYSITDKKWGENTPNKCKEKLGEDPETLDPLAAQITSFQNWLSSTYPDTTETVVNTGEDDKHKYKHQIREYTATADIQSSIESALGSLGPMFNIATSSKTTAYGGHGGRGAYISYQYTIDFNNSEALSMSAADYIKLLMKRYKAGWSEHSANEPGFSFLSGSVTSGDSGQDINAGVATEGTSVEAGAGEDANGYAAIRIGDDAYITNSRKPTGAGKTEFWVNGDGRFEMTFSDGVDADGISFYGSGSGSGGSGNGTASIGKNSSNDTKYIELVSTVPTRTYYIGGKGDSAKPLTRVFATLSKECTIKLPPISQSAPIDADTVIETPINTEFVCQGWKQPLIAVSATPTKLCKTSDGSRAACGSTTASFPVFSPYHSTNYGDFDDLGFIVLPDFYEIAAQVAEKSQFGVISRIFTKGPNLTNYGSGGDGTYYKDECLEMGGSISIRTKDSKGNIVSTSADIRFPYDPSCKMSDNERKPATAGGQGAVIISW